MILSEGYLSFFFTVYCPVQIYKDWPACPMPEIVMPHGFHGFTDVQLFLVCRASSFVSGCLPMLFWPFLFSFDNLRLSQPITATS